MLRLVARKTAGWLAMIAVATNATYFLASRFLDPASNCRTYARHARRSRTPRRSLRTGHRTHPGASDPPSCSADVAHPDGDLGRVQHPGDLHRAIITETAFGRRGMGSYFTETIALNDVHGVVAVAAFGAAPTAVGAVLADVATALLDPRVRVS